MRPLTTSAALAALSLAPACCPAAVVVSQGFDAADSDNYGFTANPTPYNQAGGTDVFSVTDRVGGITAQSGGFFWGMRDLNNPGGGGNFDHVLSFDMVDLTGFENVVLSFFYNAVGYDAGDDLFYAVNGDRVQLIDGTNGGGLSTNGWERVTVSIADTVDTLLFSLSARQNGASDFAGWDSITVTGDAVAAPAVPEPASLALFALGGLGLAAGRRRLAAR